MAKLVAQTYGEALFQLAMEQERTSSFLEEVEGISTVLAENPELNKLMEHPKISKEDKINVMFNVFGGHISTEMRGFLELIINKERYGQLTEIFQYFTDKVKEEEKIGIAYVTTAVPLSDAKKAEIKAKLLAATSCLTMEVHYEVEPEIIGGMVIRIKDRVVDSSIRTKLAEIKKDLLQIQLG